MRIKSLCFLLTISLFVWSCNNDDDMVEEMPPCQEGTFDITIDSMPWEVLGHLSEIRVEFDEKHEITTLGIEVFGLGDERLLLTAQALHLRSNGTNPDEGCFSSGNYAAESTQNSCTTTPDGSLDRCENADIRLIKAGFTPISTEVSFDGLINFDSCDGDQKKVFGSFEALIESSDQSIRQQIRGTFTDVCYRIIQ